MGKIMTFDRQSSAHHSVQPLDPDSKSEQFCRTLALLHGAIFIRNESQ
jgi:hypothetical protein